MSAAVVMELSPEKSPRFKARLAGFFWLMTIVAGLVALFADRSVVVSGDATATAANMLAHESLVRLGVASNIIATACYLTATLLVYHLLEPVNRNVSLLAAFFSLAGCAISALSLAFNLAPLVVLGGSPYLSVFTAEQLRALAYMFLRLSGQAASINFIFFGLHCLLVGSLILRSTFLPRFVGALMAFGGLGWLTMGFSNLLAPPFGRSLLPFIMIPGTLGEFTLTLWLLVMGVNAQRWVEQASAQQEWRSPRTVPA